jgi:protein-disulfide isomerase
MDANQGYLAEPKNIDTKNAYHKGNPKASITIVEFADFECPACKMASAQFNQFFKENKEDVQIYFMHFPLSSHPHAEQAAIAAEAAGKQGKFWPMHDLLFAHDGPLTEQAIQELAARLFNKSQLARFNRDRKDPALLKKINEHKEYAINEIELVGTPTFLFNGRPYNLSSSKDGYKLRLEMEKLRSTIHCQAQG